MAVALFIIALLPNMLFLLNFGKNVITQTIDCSRYVTRVPEALRKFHAVLPVAAGVLAKDPESKQGWQD